MGNQKCFLKIGSASRSLEIYFEFIFLFFYQRKNYKCTDNARLSTCLSFSFGMPHSKENYDKRNPLQWKCLELYNHIYNGSFTTLAINMKITVYLFYWKVFILILSISKSKFEKPFRPKSASPYLRTFFTFFLRGRI